MVAQAASVSLCWGVRFLQVIDCSYRRRVARVPKERCQLRRPEEVDEVRNLPQTAIRSGTKRDAVATASNSGLAAVRAL